MKAIKLNKKLCALKNISLKHEIFSLIFVLMLVFLISCSDSDKPDNQTEFIKAKIFNSDNFNDYFKEEYEVELSNEITIGQIGYLDVFQRNKLLITDIQKAKVFLFNNKGELIKDFDPELCTPGYKLIAEYAKFNKKGEVYVINRMGNGYIFNENNDCKGQRPMDNFWHAPHIDFLNSGEIVAYSILGDGNYLRLCDYKGKEIDRFGEFPNDFRHIIESIMGGGLVISSKDIIYQVNVISPEIYVYRNKNLIKKIKNDHISFNKVLNDIKDPNNFESLYKQTKKILDENTLVNYLFLVNDSTLLMQFTQNHKWYLQLIDTHEKKRLQKSIKIDEPFIFAKDGYAYKVVQPEPVGVYLPNPKIIVYKIKF